MKKLFTLILSLCFIASFAAKPKNQYVKITTNKGEVIIMLYNETPLHRDNFLKLTKDGVFDGSIFHRVIKSFMIQGGDPNTKELKPEEGFKNYTIPAEFNDNLFHKKGVLAAAREGDASNPLKASSGTQFYIVQGKVWNDSTLNDIETKRMKFKIPEWQRQVYKTIGGSPHLDRNYTVFGEVVRGLAMVDDIADVPTAKGDKPIEDIRMTVTVLKKREVRRLERALRKEARGIASEV